MTTISIECPKPDKSILRTSIVQRKIGTWAIDLRTDALGNGGRPTLKEDNERFGTKDKAAAIRLAHTLLKSIADGSAAGTPVAVLGVQSQWRAYIQNKLSSGRMTPHTAGNAETCIIRCWEILHDLNGITSWKQVTRPMIEPLVKQLQTRQFKGRVLQTNSVLKHINYLKGFFRWALDNGVVTGSPLHRHTAVPPRNNNYTREWLEPHEMGALLEASFKGRQFYPHNACHCWPEILATLAYTGARESEVLGLRVKDLTLGKGGTRGSGTLDITEYAGRRLKNQASKRTFSLWPAHAKILQAYMKRVKPPAGGLLFPGPNGQKWGELRGSMDRDLKAAGITKRITDHSLRHGFISHRSKMHREVTYRGKTTLAAVHMSDIADEVGHGSERMTREVYTHSSLTPSQGITDLDYAAALADFRKARR